MFYLIPDFRTSSGNYLPEKIISENLPPVDGGWYKFVTNKFIQMEGGSFKASFGGGYDLDGCLFQKYRLSEYVGGLSCEFKIFNSEEEALLFSGKMKVSWRNELQEILKR